MRLILLAVLALAGCSTTSQYAIYRHPATGETMECEKAPPAGGMTGVYGIMDIPIIEKYSDCKTTLDRLGYERQGTVERQETGRPKSELSRPMPVRERIGAP